MWSTLPSRRPRTIVALFAAVAAIGVVGATRVQNEEDLLVFLPRNDPDVQLFREVSQRYGALRVALIGIEGDDVLAAGAIRKLTAATRAFADVEGVDRVVSLTNVEDVTSTVESADVALLVPGPPANSVEEANLRRRVLSREQVVGSLVSADGRAALMMVYLVEGAPTRRVVRELRQVAQQTLAPLTVHFGGVPFAGDAVYGEARHDVALLSPIAVGVLFLVILLSFHDWFGLLLTLVCLGLGTATSLGLMGWLDQRFTVATSVLPVILFASGSAFPVYVLGRYYLERETHAPRAAIPATLRAVFAPLTIDAATTAIGFTAFIVMDVAPMRSFGLVCTAGIAMVWLASVTLVPAALTLLPRRCPPRDHLLSLGRGLYRLWRWSERRAWSLAAVFVAVLAGSLLPISSVEVRMEPSAFFRVGSEPWRAQQFLEQRFGGAGFLQVELRGDFDDPANLREVERLASFARALPGVTQVQSIVDPLLAVSDSMGLGRRLPETRQQVGNLHFFLLGQSAMPSLIAADHQGVLVHVRFRGAAPLAALEKYAGELRSVEGRVAGEPVLDRGFSRAVGRNQLRATLLAVAITVLLLWVLFRSPRQALISWLPAQLTLGILFGGVGLFGGHIDLGTSIVVATAVGVGADFGMYYMWSLRTQTPAQVSREIGPVGLVAVALIACGFFVMALGRSPITRLFGTLAGISTVLSAALTCVVLPVVLRVWRRSRGRGHA
jgi:hypothetical protein